MIQTGRLVVGFSRPASASVSASYGALFLRLVLAAFFWAHLYNKFFTKDGFWGWWAALTARHAAIVPIYVLTVEFSCGTLLLLGLRTRWVAAYALPAFLAIVRFWLGIGGYWFTNPGAEFPIAWFSMLILQIILGDGAYALTVVRSAR